MKMKSDYRVDYILNKGDQIYTDHEIYTITGEPLGFGGSSILYPARREGSSLEVAIKEWFPKLPANFERRHGIIQPKDPKDTVTLDENRTLFEVELKMGEEIRNATALRAIHLWGILKPIKLIIKGKEEAESDVSKGLFAVMERMDHKGKSFNQLLRYISENRSADSPLKTGGLPNIHTTALIMEQVLLALQRVHEAGENGYLFGDIQDGNIYFADAQLEQGDIGTGMLLDFGCSKPLTLKEDRKEYEHQGENIFSSQGYIPPEIAKPEVYEWKLTDKADIYSTGCLMLRCLLSRAKIKTLGCTPYYRDDLVDEVDAANIGCSESNRRLVNSILEKAMRLNPEVRSSVGEMLTDIRKLKRDTKPPEYLLPKAPGSSESFIEGSRTGEVDNVIRSLAINKPTFLWGCGGIGKSEISIKVAEEFEKCSPKGAYFVHYTVPSNKDQEAMEETVLRMPFSGYKYEPEQGISIEEQRKAEYKARIHILREHYAGALLVIDNFDWPGKTLEDLTAEKSYLEMESIDLNLLFTTRSEVPGTPEVKELSREDLLRLMRRWVTDPRITDQQLYDLIEEVDGHTLTVDLIAKCLSRSRRKVTPEMMLECLQNHKLAEVKYPVTHRALAKGEDPERLGHRDPKTAQIYQHLKALFDLSGLDEQMKTILRYATLLPAGGMDCQLFESCLEEGHEQSFEYLLYCGWFRNSSDNVLSIHPIVREVCRNELVDIDKDRDNNLRFLNKLVLAAKKQCELGAGLEFANNKMRQVVIVCEELAQRIGIVYITEDTWKEINNLLKVMGNYHLIKQVKVVYPSIGQTRIPYAETDRTTGIRSFILDESNNIQYTVGIIGLNAGSEPIVKALATTTTISGNQQYQKVYITLDEMSEADCILIFAFHKGIQVMYRYIGYLSPMGVMLNLNPLRIPRVFIHNQGNDRKTMVRVVEFSVHEVYEDLFGGRTVEEVESTFQGKVLLINPDNAKKILLSGKEIKEGAQYYADFIFSKQDGISFMH